MLQCRGRHTPNITQKNLGVKSHPWQWRPPKKMKKHSFGRCKNVIDVRQIIYYRLTNLFRRKQKTWCLRPKADVPRQPGWHVFFVNDRVWNQCGGSFLGHTRGSACVLGGLGGRCRAPKKDILDFFQGLKYVVFMFFWYSGFATLRFYALPGSTSRCGKCLINLKIAVQCSLGGAKTARSLK